MEARCHRRCDTTWPQQLCQTSLLNLVDSLYFSGSRTLLYSTLWIAHSCMILRAALDAGSGIASGENITRRRLKAQTFRAMSISLRASSHSWQKKKALDEKGIEREGLLLLGHTAMSLAHRQPVELQHVPYLVRGSGLQHIRVSVTSVFCFCLKCRNTPALQKHVFPLRCCNFFPPALPPQDAHITRARRQRTEEGVKNLASGSCGLTGNG